MNLFDWHGKHIEVNSFVMAIFMAIVLIIGVIVEEVPLFYMPSVYHRPSYGKYKAYIPKPLSALQLEGRRVYIENGCYLCHSQMIRPFRAETERYGHYSLATESMYNHPFQWGSKRTGPDLAREGGKYSDQWQIAHLNNPEALVPESVMPRYDFLNHEYVDISSIKRRLRILKSLGVPYTDKQIENAVADSMIIGKDGKKHVATKMQALVAYLQSLGKGVK